MYGRISDPQMGTYPARDTLALCTSLSQSATQTVGLGFPYRAGRYRSGGCRSCRCMEGYLTRGWDPTLPDVRWLYIRTPANQRSAGGTEVSTFLHRAERCRPGGTPSSSPGCRSFTCAEGFLIHRWEPILPGVRWRYVRASANQQPARGVGVSALCGAVSTRGITVFVPGLSEL